MVDDGVHHLLRFVGRVLIELFVWGGDFLGYVCPRLGRLVFNGALRFKRRLPTWVEGLLGFSVLTLGIIEIGFYIAPIVY